MKMKLGAIVLSASALMSTTVLAMDFDPSVYVGAEVQMNKLKAGSKEFKDSTGKSMLRKTNSPATSLQLGTRLNENVGVEVGYSLLKRSNSSFNDGANKMNYLVKMRNTYVDFLGYVPVTSDINLIGSLGMGRLSTKAQLKNNNVVQPLTKVQQDATKTKTGMRVGVGAEYKIDSNISTRAMVRYQKGNATVKNVKSVGFGLFYQF